MKTRITVLAMVLVVLSASAESYLTPNARNKIAKDRAMRARKDLHFTAEEKAAQQFEDESIKSTKQGTIGYFNAPVTIDQIVSDRKALVTFGWWSFGWHEYRAMLDNISTKGLTDNVRVRFKDKFIINGTASYTSVLGAKKTVMRITPYLPPEATTNEVSDLRPGE